MFSIDVYENNYIFSTDSNFAFQRPMKEKLRKIIILTVLQLCTLRVTINQIADNFGPISLIRLLPISLISLASGPKRLDN